MAQKKATLILELKDLASKALSNFSGGFNAVKNVVKVAAAAISGYGASVIKLAGDASKFDDVQKSFQNLAANQGQQADQMLAKMKELSQGTVSDLSLMQKANNAMLLGLPVDRFGDMLNIARSASKSTGESMDFMLSSIVTGLGRGSKMILDNLGIVFNLEDAYAEYAKTLGKTAAKLTDAEKKQAFINKALEVGSKNAEAAGMGQLSLADRFEQVKTKGSNLLIVIGQKLAPAFTYLMNKATDAFNAIEEFATSGAATDTFIVMTKAITVAKNAIVILGQTIGSSLGTSVGAITQLLSGNFKQAWETLKSGAKGAFSDVVNTAKQTNAEFKEIDAEFLKDREARNNAEIAQVKSKNQLIAEENETARLAERESWANDNITQLEEKIAFEEYKKEQENAQQMAAIEQEITNAQTKEARLSALKKKAQAEEDARQNYRRSQMTAMQKFEDMINSDKVKGTQQALASISTLQDSKNKELVALGKAAAIANITVSTAQGVAAAWALGPILGPILAPLVAVAGVVQAAKVSGVQLAEGGIVKATQGGIQATIGEGGQDEAVIPLEKGGAGLGNQITINNYGGMLGTDAEAREFALVIDQELMKLRRNKESLAFDSDLT